MADIRPPTPIPLHEWKKRWGSYLRLMCGIVGTTGGHDLRQSLEALSRRGPDRQASMRSGNVTLGQCRLSIIDPTPLADQPMRDPSGRYTLVYNGEVYNFKELASPLRGSGVDFKSESDTEVVLHHLIRHGLKGLKDLNGFFALSFYDQVDDRLIVARDRFGIKPLYWSENDGQLSFASEMKALRPLLPATTIDRTAAYFYFLLNYIPGEMSIYEEVNKLAPGHSLVWENGEVSISPFSPELPEPARLDSNHVYEENVLRLRSLLDDSVRDRLMADVPLGCFLSGGVDSSIIASIASEHTQGLKTFSIGFKDNSYFDESIFSQEVADHLGTDHHVFQLSNEEMLDHVMATLEYTDEPFADSSAIAVHALSRMSRGVVTVALSGDGADELFGGYNKHAAHLRADNRSAMDSLLDLAGPVMGMIPASRGSAVGNKSRQLQRYLKGAKMAPRDRYWHWASWTEAEEVKELLAFPIDDEAIHTIQSSYHDNSQGLAAVLRADLRMLLPGDMLTKVDRMSMANGLEVRVPFLDHRLVDLAMQLPIDQRIRAGDRKRILKDAYRDDLPASVFDRPKKGFEVPLESWFKGPLRETVEQALDPERAASHGLLDQSFIKNLRARFRAGRSSNEVHLIWALVVWDRVVNGS